MTALSGIRGKWRTSRARSIACGWWKLILAMRRTRTRGRSPPEHLHVLVVVRVLVVDGAAIPFLEPRPYPVDLGRLRADDVIGHVPEFACRAWRCERRAPGPCARWSPQPRSPAPGGEHAADLRERPPVHTARRPPWGVSLWGVPSVRGCVPARASYGFLMWSRADDGRPGGAMLGADLRTRGDDQCLRIAIRWTDRSSRRRSGRSKPRM